MITREAEADAAHQKKPKYVIYAAYNQSCRPESGGKNIQQLALI